jgi:hypothetical protein
VTVGSNANGKAQAANFSTDYLPASPNCYPSVQKWRGGRTATAQCGDVDARGLFCYRKSKTRLLGIAFPLTDGERLFEPFELRLTALASQIISCLLCSTTLGNLRVPCGRSASGSVILPRSQNQNKRDLFWNVKAVNRSSNLIVGSQPVWFEKSPTDLLASALAVGRELAAFFNRGRIPDAGDNGVLFVAWE